ncbi:MAG: hypothetical protein GX443_02165 [Deltaproteobacteria bacterium]|nr:hypothetical protein [Deltaproteobacteria bacterium]
MLVGIGCSNTEDAFLSGRRAAGQAMERGAVSNAHCVLAFCHGQLNHEEFLHGIHSLVGNGVPVLGGSAIGVITNHFLSYEGHPAAVAVFQWEFSCCRFEVSEGLHLDERRAGSQLVRCLEPQSTDRLMLIFYDSIRIPGTLSGPPSLNASSLVLQGIEQLLDPRIPVVGAGLVGDYGFGPVRQFCGSRVSSQALVGMMFSGEIIPYCRVMHGCTPLDGRYHVITAMEGSSVFELDGRPVVERIDEIYGNRQWRLQHPVNLLALGVNHGEKWGPAREFDYVSRLITGILPDGSGISLFEPDLLLGAEVQFMIRDNATMIESARKNSQELMEAVRRDGKRPLFALYIDCAGRTAACCNAPAEEAREVQECLNRYGVPLLGFYSGVEIAPLLRRSRGLDWTGVLLVLAGDEGNGNTG